MATKKMFLDAFYTQFSDFLTQLIQVFPNDLDFPAYLTGVKLLHRTNPMLLVSEVLKHTSQFEDLIRSKNEDFFLKHTFSEYTSDNDAMENLIRKMKDMWATMSDNDKKCVWSYTNLLLDIAKRC
jgi:hypothetical protein